MEITSVTTNQNTTYQPGTETAGSIASNQNSTSQGSLFTTGSTETTGSIASASVFTATA